MSTHSITWLQRGGEGGGLGEGWLLALCRVLIAIHTDRDEKRVLESGHEVPLILGGQLIAPPRRTIMGLQIPSVHVLTVYPLDLSAHWRQKKRKENKEPRNENQ